MPPRLYPYFINRAKRESDPIKKKFFYNLGIGKCALTRSSYDGKRDVVVVDDDDVREYAIDPDDRGGGGGGDDADVFYMFWRREFVELGNAIKTAKTSWVNIKKKERLRLIDEYVANLANAADETRAVVSMALVLKLVSQKDIEYKDFKVVAVDLGDLRCFDARISTRRP